MREAYGSFSRWDGEQGNPRQPVKYLNPAAGLTSRWKNHPSKFILYIDSAKSNEDFRQICIGVAEGTTNGIGIRHSGHANALMIDGHVESLSPNSLRSFGTGTDFSWGGIMAPNNPGSVFIIK
jgi:prepilin-type processing-associated H-X9-DG protein